MQLPSRSAQVVLIGHARAELGLGFYLEETQERKTTRTFGPANHGSRKAGRQSSENFSPDAQTITKQTFSPLQQKTTGGEMRTSGIPKNLGSELRGGK